MVSTAWSLTVGWVSNLRRPPTESNCLGTGTEIGGLRDSVSVVGAWSTPAIGTTSCDKILKDTRVCQWNVGRISVTHIVGLLELGWVGASDKWREEDKFPSKDPVNLLFLRMRLLSGCISFDMMIVSQEKVATTNYSHGYTLDTSSVWQEFCYLGPGPYSSLCYLRRQASLVWPCGYLLPISDGEAAKLFLTAYVHFAPFTSLNVASKFAWFTGMPTTSSHLLALLMSSLAIISRTKIACSWSL